MYTCAWCNAKVAEADIRLAWDWYVCKKCFCELSEHKILQSETSDLQRANTMLLAACKRAVELIKDLATDNEETADYYATVEKDLRDAINFTKGE